MAALNSSPGEGTKRSQPITKFMYKCAFDGCDFKTVDKDGFKIHNLLKHVKDGIEYPCAYCAQTFSGDEQLLNHQEIHKANIFKCMVEGCLFATRRVSNYRVHIQTEHADCSPYSCCFCDHADDNTEALSKHVEKHVIWQVKCLYCSLTAQLKKEVQEHISVEHPNMPKKIAVSALILQSVEDPKEDVEEWNENGTNSENIGLPHGVVVKTEPGLGPENPERSLTPTVENPFPDFSDASDALNALSSGSATIHAVGMGNQVENGTDNLFSKEGSLGITMPNVSIKEEPMDPELDQDDQQVLAELDSALAVVEPEAPEGELHIGEVGNGKPLMETFMTHKCTQCNYTTPSDEALIDHAAQHGYQQDRSHNFICRQCPYSSNNLEDFRIHLQYHTDETALRMYMCAHCDYITSQMGRIEDHLLDVHTSMAFKFEVSQENVHFMQLLMPCPICNFPLLKSDETVKRLHMSVGHSEAELREYVLQSMLGGGNMMGGLSLLASPSPSGVTAGGKLSGQMMTCDLCNFSTSDRNVLREHHTKHQTREGITTGLSASNVLGTLSLEETDEQEPVDDGTMVYECPMCPFQTMNNALFEEHLTDHQNGEPVLGDAPLIKGAQQKGTIYRCDVCPYWTTIAKYLWRHKSVHRKAGTTFKHYRCGYCSYISTRSQAMSWHINRYHPGKDKKFYNNNQLKIFKNTSFKPALNQDGYYDCDKCPYKSHNIKYMYRHYKLHGRVDVDGGKQYKCGYCKYMCLWKKTMSWHINRYHPGKERRMTMLENDGTSTAIQTTPRTAEESVSMGHDESEDSANMAFQATLHNGVYMYRCDKCDYQTKYYKYIRRHANKHVKNKAPLPLKDPTKVFKCGYCRYSMKYKKTVSWHIGRYHPGREKKITVLRLPNFPQNFGPSGISSRSRISSRASSSDEAPPEIHSSKLYQQLTKRLPGISKNLVTTEQQLPVFPQPLDELSVFELSLPNVSMLPTSVTCPQCPYQTKIKYNMVRHLKQHKPDLTGTVIENDDMDTSQDVLNNLLAQQEAEEGMMDDDEDDGLEIDEEDEGSEFEEEPIVEESDKLPEDPMSLDNWELYCDRLPNGLYKCKECDTQNRYVSRVMRHHRIKHLKLMAFKCGYCIYEAAEQWMIKKHCMSTHTDLPVSVISQVHSPSKPSTLNPHNMAVPPRVSTPSSTATYDQMTDSPCSVPPLNMELSDDEDVEMEELKDGDNGLSTDRFFWSVSQLDKFFTRDPHSTTKTDCSFCGYKADKAAVKRHICARHLRVLPFACKYCTFAYVEFNKVRRHVEQSHPDQQLIVVRKSLHDMLRKFDHETVETLIGKGILDQEGTPNRGQTKKLAVPLSSTKRPESRCSQPSPALSFDSVKVKEERIDDNIGIAQTGSTKLRGRSISPVRVSASGKKPGKKTFKCMYCGYVSIWNLVDVKRHIIRKHFHTESYVCFYCNYKDTTISTVRKHIKRAHRNKPIKVKDSHADLEKVVPMQEDDTIVVYGLTGEDGLPIMATTKGDPSLPFDSIDINKHKPPSKPPTVTIPPRTSSNGSDPTDVASNMVTKFGRVLSGTCYRCKQCGMLKKGPAVAKEHVLMRHFQMKPYQCPICHEDFWKKHTTQEHIQTIHGSNAQPDTSIHLKDAELTEQIEKIELPTAGITAGPVSTSEPELGSIDNPIGASNVVGYTGADMEEEEEEGPSDLQGSFQCDMCNYASSSMEKFNAHVKTHFQSYGCHYCAFTSKSQAAVQSHCSHTHKGKPVKINDAFGVADAPSKKATDEVVQPKPPTAFKRPSQAADPSSILSQSTRYNQLECSICKIMFPNKKAVDKHMLDHLVYGPFKCNICSLVIGYKQKVQEHFLQQHEYLDLDFSLVKAGKTLNNTEVGPDGRPIKKDSDGISVSSMGSSKEEEEAQFIGKPDTVVSYFCRICKIACATLSSLRHHVMTHFDYRPYLCPYCEKFTSVRSFPIKKHIASVHHGRRKDFILNKNDEMERLVSKSMGRVVYDEDNKEHILPILSPYLTREEKAEAIRYKSFSQSQSLQAANAAAKRPATSYPTYAESPSKRYRTLGKNRTSHLDPSKQKYHCPICGSSQASPIHLRRHVMREIEYKPYLCRLCSYRDINMSGLRSHFRRKHHSEEQVKVIHRRHLQKEAKVEELMAQAIANRVNPWEETGGEDDMATSFAVQSDGANLGDGSHATGRAHFSTRPVAKKSTGSRKHVTGGGQFGTRYSAPKSSSVSYLSVCHEGPALAAQVSPPSKRVYTSPPSAIVYPKPDTSGRLLCPHCSWSTKTPKVFYMHMRRHGPKAWKCMYCSLREVFRSTVQYHQRKDHPNRPEHILHDPNFGRQQSLGSGAEANILPDAEDEVGTGAANGIAVHIKPDPDAPEEEDEPLPDISADESGMFHCPKCPYSNIKMGFVAMHMTQHQPPNFKCNHCDKKYRLLYIMRRHCRTCHPGSPIWWQNVRTGRNHMETDDNIEHMVMMETQTGETGMVVQQVTSPPQVTSLMYCCHICRFSANSVQDLMYHVDTCHRLNADLPQSPQLSWGVSTDLPPLSATLPVSEPEETISTVMGTVRSLRCTFCSFTTVVEEELRRHATKHIAQKPFCCAYCNFSAFYRLDVRRHCERRHPESVFECLSVTHQGSSSAEPSGVAPIEYRDKQPQNQYRRRHPVVELHNAIDLPESELEALLNCYGIKTVSLIM